MKTLHLLRSVPDERTRELIAVLSDGKRGRTIALFDPTVDYADVVAAIFAAERVVSWW